MLPHEVDDIWAALLAWDWFFLTPALVPYSSGRTDDSFDAVAMFDSRCGTALPKYEFSTTILEELPAFRPSAVAF